MQYYLYFTWQNVHAINNFLLSLDFEFWAKLIKFHFPFFLLCRTYTHVCTPVGSYHAAFLSMVPVTTDFHVCLTAVAEAGRRVYELECFELRAVAITAS